MVDLMQEAEFIKVGIDSRTGQKLYMIKDGNGNTYTEAEVKEMFRQNNKELQKEIETKKKKVKKDDSIKETDKTGE